LVVFFRFLRGKKKTIPDFRAIDVHTLLKFIYEEKSRNAAPGSINRRLNTVDVLYRHCYGVLIPGTKSSALDPHKMRSRRYLAMDAKIGAFPIYAKQSRSLRVKMAHQLIDTLEPDEVNAFLSTLKTDRDRAIVTLMLVCGLRSMEVVGLSLDHVNFLSLTLKILGKGNKERIIPLPKAVADVLEKYIEVERPVRRGFEHDRTVFLTMKGPKRGMPMSLEGLRALFRYKRTVSGVRHANPHRFRHTFGRNMASGGMSLPTLQRMLGHSDHRTTIRYINLTIQDVTEEFERASESLKALYETGRGESV
jgi:site-specific recombinase XerD